MRRLAYILCLAELLLLILVPLAAWLASVLKFDVVNLVSEEGLRWLFSHGAKALASYQLIILILLLSAVGAVHESGVYQDFRQSRFRNRPLRITAIFFLFIMLMLVLPFFMTHNPLLGVTGSFAPSPWLYGTPLVFCVTLIFCSLLYSALKGRLKDFMDIPSMLSYGISHHGIWIVVAMMGSFIVRVIKYSFLS